MDYDPNDPAWALIDRLKAALLAAEADGTLNDETFVQIAGAHNARVAFEPEKPLDETHEMDTIVP